MRTLLLLSGGVESTSTLKWLLTQTSDQVVVAHISATNHVQRAHLELQAVLSINHTFMEKYRPYRFHHIQLDWNVQELGSGYDVVDADVQLAFLPALILGIQPDRVLRGQSKEDWDDHKFISSTSIGNHCRAWLTGRRPNLIVDFPVVDPISTWPKAQHIKYLAEDFPLTWSCLSPRHNKQCGYCKTCKAVEKALNTLTSN